MRPPAVFAHAAALFFLLVLHVDAERPQSTQERSGGVLATDVGLMTQVQSMVSTSSFARLHEAASTRHMSRGVGGGVMKMMMGCACLVVLYKLITMIDCSSKKLDIRRIRPCGKFLLWSGWDEFSGFRASVTVHSVADVKATGMMGGDKVFKVKVAFKWSQFITSSTADMRWDQTKGMDCPQGADECVLTLYSEGKLKDSELGSFVLETKRDMLDARKFWGEKKKFKLDNKGKLVGTIIVTFRNSDDPTLSQELPIDGIDEDSGLALVLRDSYEEMVKAGIVPPLPKPPPPAPMPKQIPGQPPPEPPEPPEMPPVPKLTGNNKIDCLARCITGPLREIEDKTNKEAGKTFIRVINCNYAELKGDDMKEEAAKQWAKASDKGLRALPKKWYWAWYEDKKAAFHDEKVHYPDGFIPMTSISKINRFPERNDQFVISYSEGGDKSTLTYRREAGIGLDVWLDGIDLCFNACRLYTKFEKENEDRQKKGLPPLEEAP